MSWEYQVAGWDEWFESAKSKTYKHKSQCYTPNKHGLGYLRLVKKPNGPASAIIPYPPRQTVANAAPAAKSTSRWTVRRFIAAPSEQA